MPGRDEAPLTWVNGQPKNNMVILTDRAVYVATVKPKDFATIDLGLEDGQEPEDLLEGKKFQRIGLRRLMQFYFRDSKMFPNFHVWLVHDENGTDRTRAVNLGNIPYRDAFLQALNARVGGWLATREAQSPLVVIPKYLVILFLIFVVTAFLSVAYLSNWIETAHFCFALLVNTCGVWGILGVGVLFSMLTVGIGIRELVQPTEIVTYEPDNEEPE